MFNKINRLDFTKPGWILLLASMLSAVGSTPAGAGELGDIAGSWTVLVMIPDAAQLAELEVSETETGLLARIKSPLGEGEIDDIELDGDTYILTYMMDLGDQPMDIQITGTLVDEILSGTILVGGGAMELDYKAAHAGTEQAAALEAEAAASGAHEAHGEPFDTQAIQGDWVMKVSTFRGDRYVDLSVGESEGSLTAEFQMPPPLEVSPVEEITVQGDRLVMSFKVKFGNSDFDMTINLAQTEEIFTGKMEDNSGLFTSDITVMTKEAAAVEQAENEAAGNDGDDDDDDVREDKTISIDEKSITISHSTPKTDGPSYPELDGLADGSVVRFVESFATKLRTECELQFGDIVVPIENVSKDYPGVYSVWLRRQGDQWSLVFNDRPDIWGTQHDPAADRCEVPLAFSTSEEAARKFNIDLEQDEQGGTIRIAWGDKLWETSFTARP